MDVIESHMRQHPGRSREQAVEDLTGELPDLKKILEETATAAFNETILKMVQTVQTENPGLSYSEAFTQVQKLAPEIFSGWISLN